MLEAIKVAGMYTNFKKSLGQNFLKDEHYIQKIVDCVHYDDISNFLEKALEMASFLKKLYN